MGATMSPVVIGYDLTGPYQPITIIACMHMTIVCCSDHKQYPSEGQIGSNMQVLVLKPEPHTMFADSQLQQGQLWSKAQMLDLSQVAGYSCLRAAINLSVCSGLPTDILM